MNVEQVVKRLAAAHLGLKTEPTLKTDISLRSDVDPFDLNELRKELKSTLKIYLSMDEVSKCRTLGDLVRCINRARPLPPGYVQYDSEHMAPLPALVTVRVYACTFGPHTAVFGILVVVLLGEKRLLQYDWGRGGNNRRERGTFAVDIPDDFHTKDSKTQAEIIANKLRTAGADLLYTTSPGRKGLSFDPTPREYTDAVGDDCRRYYEDLRD